MQHLWRNALIPFFPRTTFARLLPSATSLQTRNIFKFLDNLHSETEKTAVSSIDATPQKQNQPLVDSRRIKLLRQQVLLGNVASFGDQILRGNVHEFTSTAEKANALDFLFGFGKKKHLYLQVIELYKNVRSHYNTTPLTLGIYIYTLSSYAHAFKTKSLDKGKLEEAEAVFSDFLQQNKFETFSIPDFKSFDHVVQEVYCSMISVYSNANQTEKALGLLDVMKSRYLIPSGPVITSLFVACRKHLNHSNQERQFYIEKTLQIFKYYKELIAAHPSQYELLKLDEIGFTELLLCLKEDLNSFAFISVFEELCQILDFANHHDQQKQLQAVHYTILIEWLIKSEYRVYKLQREQPEESSKLPKLLLYFLPRESEAETLPVRVVEHMKSMNVDDTPYNLGLLIHRMTVLKDPRCFVLFYHMEHELRIPSNIATLKCLLDFSDVVYKKQLITEGDLSYLTSRAITLASKIANNTSQYYLLPNETLSCILQIYQKTKTKIPSALYDFILEKMRSNKNFGARIEDDLHYSLQIWCAALMDNAISLEDFDAAKRVAQTMLQSGLIPDSIFFYRMQELEQKEPRARESISILYNIRKDSKLTVTDSSLSVKVNQFRQEKDFETALSQFNALKEKNVLSALDYIQLIRMASEKRDVNAFTLFAELKKAFPDRKPFKAYQALFNNFYHRQYKELLWDVYINYFRNDSDGKDPYVYAKMLKLVERGSDRESQIKADVEKFGLEIRNKSSTSALDQQYQDGERYDVSAEFSQRQSNKFRK